MKKIIPLTILGVVLVSGGVLAVNQSNGEPEAESSKISKSLKIQSSEAIIPMNIQQLADGNYLSVQGTWQNNQGQELVFDQNGLVTQNIYNQDVVLSDGQISNDFFHQEMMSSRIAFIPADVVGNPDVSNTSQDRMVVTQNGLVITDNDAVFYLK